MGVHRRTSPQEAERILRALGYEPVEPYPGRKDLPWQVRCIERGCPRRVCLGQMMRAKNGGRCAHRDAPLDPQEAERILRALGYEPVEPYPGRKNLPWQVRCIERGCPRRVYLGLARYTTGRGRCAHVGASREGRSGAC